MRGSGRGTPRRPDPPEPRQERPTANFARATAALLVPFVVAGCLPQQPDELPVRVKHVRDVDSLVLLLDAYRTSPAQRRLMQRAEKTLVSPCLRRFRIAVDFGDPAAPPFSQNARRYGLADEARASKLGYSTPEITRRPPRPNLPPLARKAAWGDGPAKIRGRNLPEGGCVGEAGRTLSTGAPPAGILADLLAFSTLETSAKDRRVRVAFGRWSSCMKRSGHTYATPKDANRDRRFIDGPDHRVSPTETATAVTDVRCKHQAHLIDVWAGVGDAYQRRLIARHKSELDRERATHAIRLSIANKALETSG
ncbi:hypothetical protein [Actinomadura bangladeshensis]|uniref:Uncharacterized protein n=1 Tax=Actinomadura bangladeshensis TaxID=453573 RepID=A0A4R4NEE4_9ACTN|nr:hypothetical protein [Actinomadura bangladeshensis]TDC06744.1 hypothetical protein E1284_33405 [Actinomadura bangladeshensis]